MRGTLEERFWPKVDKTTNCWNWTASKLSGGYGHFHVNGRARCAHRVSYEIANGPIPEGMDIDHICHNKSCVNPSHLRAVTHKQNLEHRAGAQSRNKSGVRGVTWSKLARKWSGSVVHNYKSHYLGLFDSIAEAEAAVIAKRLELFTHNDADRAEAS